MKRMFAKFVVFVLLINQILPVCCTTLGSTTVMSQQSAAVANSTTILDGCIFATGLSTVSTGYTNMGWSSVYSTNGAINWKGATVALLRDFQFGGNGTLTGAAIFNCNNFSVRAPEASAPFAISSAITINGGTLRLNSTTNVTATITFQGTSVLDGGGNVINMNSGGNITVASGASLTIVNATIIGLTTSGLTMGATTSSLTLENVTMNMGAGFNFVQGAVTITGNVTIGGAGSTNGFTYSSAQTFTISALSTLTIGPNSAIGFVNNVLTFAASTSTLFLNGAGLISGPSGVTLTTGELIVAGPSYFSSTSSTAGMNFGNGTGGSDPTINILSNSTISVNSGTLTYNMVNANLFNMADSTSTISFASGTTLKLSLNLPNTYGIIIFGNGVTLSSHLGAIVLGSTNINGTLTYTTF